MAPSGKQGHSHNDDPPARRPNVYFARSAVARGDFDKTVQLFTTSPRTESASQRALKFAALTNFPYLQMLVRNLKGGLFDFQFGAIGYVGSGLPAFDSPPMD